MIKICAVLLCCFFSLGTLAQKNAIDSLRALVLKSSGDVTGVKLVKRINLLNQLAGNLAKQDSAQSYLYASQAKTLSEKINYLPGQAEAYRTFGIALIAKNHLPAALSAFNKSLYIHLQLKNAKEAGVIYSDIGIAYLSQNKREEASEYFIKAEKIHRGLNDIKNLLTDVNQLGVLSFQAGENQRAVKYYIEAAALSDQTHDEGAVAQIYNNIAQLLTFDKNYVQAKNYLFKAITINKKLDKPKDLGIDYVNLANIYTNEGNFNQGYSYFGNALTAFFKSNFTKGIQVCYNNLGALALRQEKYLESIPFLEKSLSISRSSKNYTGLALTEQNIAYAYMKMGRNAEAAALYKQAEQSAILYKNNIAVFGEIYNHQSMLDSIIGDYKSAFLNRNKYLRIKDSLQNEKISKQIAEIQTKYETEKKEKTIQLLNRQNTIQALNLKNQDLHLLQSKLEIDRNKLYAANQAFRLNKKQEESAMRGQKIRLLETRNTLAGVKANFQLARKNRTVTGLIASLIALLVISALVVRNMRLKSAKLKTEKALAVFEAEQGLLNEKLRISGELHDNIGSQLTFIHSSIQSMRGKYDTGNQLVLKETEEITVNTIRELRQTVWFINNSTFTPNDFAIRLREYIKPYQSLANTTLTITNHIPQTVVLSAAKATHLFRIVQEAINNAVKYAGAHLIEVQLKQNGNCNLVINIKDDGCGFNTCSETAGFGLRNMEARAIKAGGNIEVLSLPSKGTNVQVNIPV